MSLVEQATKSLLPSWGLPAHGREVRGLKRMKTDLLDHPTVLDSQPLLTAAHLTCPSNDSPAASSGAISPG